MRAENSQDNEDISGFKANLDHYHLKRPPRRLLAKDYDKGIKFWGIAMPEDISKLFPKCDETKSNFPDFAPNKITTWLSSATASKTGLDLHSESNCLACYRLKVKNSSDVRKKSVDSVHSEDDLEDGTLRKEVLRFVVAMTASVGVKTAEQGLLK